jgi:CheY-like chemotaxis protein
MAKTILCVDDSPSMQQMVKLTLAGAGYQVVQAGDGVEGLAKAKQGAVSNHGIRRGPEAGGEGCRCHRMDHQAVPAGSTDRRRAQGDRVVTALDPTETFRQEAQELLETQEQALLDLGNHPDCHCAGVRAIACRRPTRPGMFASGWRKTPCSSDSICEPWQGSGRHPSPPHPIGRQERAFSPEARRLSRIISCWLPRLS